MITPVYEATPPPGQTRPLTDCQRLLHQIAFREVLTGPEAARRIARIVEDQGGFWGPRKVG